MTENECDFTLFKNKTTERLLLRQRNEYSCYKIMFSFPFLRPKRMKSQSDCALKRLKKVEMYH